MDAPSSRPLKRLLNRYEKVTHETLSSICAREGTSIFAKVRLADIFPIEGSGLSDRDFEFALKAHLDFTVVDKNLMPLFAVEYDGRMHDDSKQQQRDAIKNRLCAKFKLPLLRIKSSYLSKDYRGMDLLSWFVETWFAEQAFTRAQEQGYIPLDEPFMGASFMEIPGHSTQFPLWLSADVRIKIRQLFDDQKCSDPMPSYCIGADKDNTLRALCWCRVAPSTVVSVKTAMRAQSFPVSASEALSEIVVHILYKKLVDAISGRGRVDPLGAFELELKRFQNKYALHEMAISTCGGIGGSKLRFT